MPVEELKFSQTFNLLLVDPPVTELICFQTLDRANEPLTLSPSPTRGEGKEPSLVHSFLHQILHHTGISEGRDVTKLFMLIRGNLAQNAAHDFS